MGHQQYIITTTTYSLLVFYKIWSITHAFDQTKPPDNFPNDYDVMKPPENLNSTQGNGVYFLSHGTTIDVVLQNANELRENQNGIHP